MTESSPLKPSTVIDRLLTNRWLMLICFISTLISVPLTVYFYAKQLPSRQMYAQEAATRSVFVSRQSPSVLEVRAKGAPVNGKDVFAVQIAVWNGGNQTIRPENVLEQVILHAMGGSEIVEARIARSTRSVCAAAVTIEEPSCAKLHWKVLEPGDGVWVQLILVGNKDDRVGLSGIVESSGGIRFTRTAPSSPSRISDPITEFCVGPLILFLLGPALTWMIVSEWRQRKLNDRWWVTAVRLLIGIPFTLAFLGYFAMSLEKWRMAGSMPEALAKTTVSEERSESAAPQ